MIMLNYMSVFRRFFLRSKEKVRTSLNEALLKLSFGSVSIIPEEKKGSGGMLSATCIRFPYPKKSKSTNQPVLVPSILPFFLRTNPTFPLTRIEFTPHVCLDKPRCVSFPWVNVNQCANPHLCTCAYS